MDFQFLKDKEMTLSSQLYPFHVEDPAPAQGKSPGETFFFFLQTKEALTSTLMQAKDDELCLIKN